MSTDAQRAPAGDVAGLPRHELRVLRGLHAGARAPLQEAPGAQVSVGRTTDNDIVLRDAPRRPSRGAIALDASGWTWAAAAGAGPVALPLGKAVRFGSAVFTVDDAGAPWPEGDSFELMSESPEPTAPEAADATPDTTPDDSPAEPKDLTMATEPSAACLEAAPPAAQEPAPAPGATRSRAKRWLRAPVLVVAVAGVAALGWLTLNLLTTHATSTAIAAPLVPSVNEDTVRKLVGSLGLSDSLKVQTTRDSRIEIHGVVDTDTQRDDLRERLQVLEPTPSSNVLTRPEFKVEVDALARTLEPGLSLAIKGRGKLLLSGMVAEADEIEALSQRIASELPSAIQVDTALKTPPEIVEDFSRELHRLGLPMHTRWDGSQMLIEGKLPPERMAQWENLLLDFNRKHGERMHFSTSLANDPPPAAARAASIVLPQINSVVGGNAPYIVLADGQKIMVGGSLNGYELVAIRDDALVLRAGGQGPLREVPR